MTIALTIYLISFIICLLVWGLIVYEDGCTLSDALKILLLTIIPVINTCVALSMLSAILDVFATLQIIKPKDQRNKNAETRNQE